MLALNFMTFQGGTELWKSISIAAWQEMCSRHATVAPNIPVKPATDRNEEGWTDLLLNSITSAGKVEMIPHVPLAALWSRPSEGGKWNGAKVKWHRAASTNSSLNKRLCFLVWNRTLASFSLGCKWNSDWVQRLCFWFCNCVQPSCPPLGRGRKPFC